MKYRITGILLIVVILFVNSKSLLYAKETPDELKNLYARSAVLMDADNGRILFGKNESDILPMASTTKIMTCIIALENMKQNEVGVVSECAKKQPKVHLGIRVGEKYYLKDLLYSLMLESHNDSAVVIAETIGGSVKGFADMMNQKAKEIGCKDTYFITPNGLDATDETGVHSTTASDLALIMRYCVSESTESKAFLKISQTNEYQFTDIELKRNFICYNHNAFLKMMDGVIAGKTGFTNAAGYCYVGVLQSKNRTFIVSLLACGWPNNKNYKWQDTRTLMEYGVKNYRYQNVDNQKLERNLVRTLAGMNMNEPLKANDYIETEVLPFERDARILVHKNEKFDVKTIIEHQINAPVKIGQKVGVVYYLLNDEIVMKRDIVSITEMETRSIVKYIAYIARQYITCDLRKV